MNKIINSIKGIITIGIIFSFLGIGIAEEKKGAEVKKKTLTKSVQGEVSGISYNFIAVIYDQDEKSSYEMALNVPKDVKIEHKNRILDIGVGDIVDVTYEETQEIKGDEKPRLLSRIAKVVKFLKPAEKIVESTALVSEETPVSSQQDNQEIQSQTE
jgi:hypothetical protein